MAENECRQCGANGVGMVCEYCGNLLRGLVDVEEEKQALGRFHQLLQEADRSKQSRLLRSGFLPEYEEAIIAAGLRCIPLINNAEVSAEPRESALLRLRMIVSKLNLISHSKKASRAIREFEAILQSSARSERWYVALGLVVVVLILCVVLGGIYFGFFAR